MYEDYKSSTKLNVSWDGTANNLKLVYQEITPSKGPIQEIDISNSENSIIIDELKSSSTYNVELQSCESTCKTLDSAEAETSEEYWQVQGDADCLNDQDCVDTSTIVIEDSATAAYALKYPDQDKTTLYTNTKPLSENGPMKAFGENNGGTELLDFLKFDWIEGPYIHTCDRHKENCDDIEVNMATYQIIPLAKEEATLLVFEGMTFEENILKDGNKTSKETTQLYQMKSYDGYTGLDYNSDKNTSICDFEDLQQGANCDYELILAANEENGFNHVRQTKIAYPILDSIYWDEADGTFMAITGQDKCGLTDDGIFMAILKNKSWEIVENENCPEPLFTHGHGPVVVHLGESKYKLYAETYEIKEGESYQITKVTKPLQIIYADGSLEGSNDVDLTEFENENFAREVNFLWANGDLVSPGYESGFGDHMIFLPDYNLENQIMFLNLNGFDNTDTPNGSPGIGIAILLNP